MIEYNIDPMDIINETRRAASSLPCRTHAAKQSAKPLN